MDRSDSPEPSCVDPQTNFNTQPDHGSRSDSPEPSCVSMKSHQSLDPQTNFNKQPDHGLRSDSPEPSCVSMKSHQSLDSPTNFNTQPDHAFRSDPPEPSCVSMRSHQSLDSPSNFLKQIDLSIYQESRSKPDCQQSKDSSSSLNSCTAFSLNSVHHEVLKTFTSNLKKKFECLYEGTSQKRNPTLLNEIYTELYITESESGEISHEHEVRQIETQSRRTQTEDTPITCNDIFKALPEQHKPIRSVLTKGIAGIGKTVSVQKFILDWTEGKENQDVQVIFPLPFRELNLMKNQTLSLLELLHIFFPETTDMDMFSGEYKVLFIFDGLDECRLSLDFHNSVRLCDVRESVSVEVMLSNLIAGNLLPSALIWITSRPAAAADLLPSDCVDRVTEVRGFTDKQKEEYFRKRISDESLNNRIISHLKSSRSLYIMCHIPVFCWISATVLERMLSEAESEGEIPKTLTQMYTHFLIIQTNIKHQKDYEKNDEDMIMKLGKLAFEQLVKGNVIFYEEDLRECGIDVAEASVYSGLCTQIFREEFGLCQGKVYCFVHLSIQEHLAALYVLLSFLLRNRDVLKEVYPLKHVKRGFTCDTISDVHQRAVDKALQSQNGHLDLFLRFLLGLLLESNQKLLQDLLKHTVNVSWSKTKTADYINIRIRMNSSPQKSMNLFHCLNELGDQSLVSEVEEFVKSGNLSSRRFSSSQWSAVVFVLLTSEPLHVFELSKYISTFKNKDNGTKMEPDKVLQKLLPVLEASRSAQLSDCKLTENCCTDLTLVLTSSSSCLRELHLSGNYLKDSGLKLLSAGLKNPNCKLEKLTLWDCGVTDSGCDALVSALKSNPSHLRELNLSGNKLGDSVMKLLDRLKNPNCKLEKLELSCCDVTDKSCDALASVLSSNSHLRDLSLSDNKLGSTGVKLLCAGLKNPNCKLNTLKLHWCGVTEKGCGALASALTSNPSHLGKLDLSHNKLGGSGVKLLSAGLKNPKCKLETLVLWDCGVTENGCAALTSVLISNSHLRKLNLSNNKVGDSGLKMLSAGLENPNCKLEKLELSRCGVTHKGCVALASAMKSNPSHLRDLNLSVNNIGGSGVKLLSDRLKSPNCNLETLRLGDCGVTDEGCDALASALTLNSNLRYLNLSNNKLGESVVKTLSVTLKNPDCKLEKLRLCGCGVTGEACVALKSALKSNPHLKKLILTGYKTTTFRNEAGL